ncbi:hypothetical protein CR513_60982, partial [Mucuna pruriens]
MLQLIILSVYESSDELDHVIKEGSTRDSSIIPGQHSVLIFPRKVGALEPKRGRQYPLHVVSHIVRTLPRRTRGFNRQLVQEGNLINRSRVHEEENRFIATGTIRSVSSAKRALNLKRKGSRHVVPSGHTTKSPLDNSRLIFSASMSRVLVSLTVGMGERISDSLEMEYVTAGTLRRRTDERTTGSIRVRCVQTKSTPELPPEGGKGGLPFTMTLLPNSLDM